MVVDYWNAIAGINLTHDPRPSTAIC